MNLFINRDINTYKKLQYIRIPVVANGDVWRRRREKGKTEWDARVLGQQGSVSVVVSQIFSCISKQKFAQKLPHISELLVSRGITVLVNAVFD